jgi:hypothetical protein
MIDKIIDELSDINQSLVGPLLKAKIIGKRLDNSILVNWIDKELNGYTPEEELPNYRIASAVSNCTIQQGINYQNNTPVPISYIRNETLKSIFTGFPLIQSVGTLEQLEKDSRGDRLGKPYPVDFWAFVTNEMKKSGAQFQVRDIEVFTDKSSITQTLNGIRNKFLDIILKFENELKGKNLTQMKVEEKKELSNKITIIMQQNNIKNTGDGSAINLGDNSQVNAAKGENITQKNIQKDEEIKIRELIELIKQFHSESDFEDKMDSEIELKRLENQMQKENPNKSIIKSSLETIKGFAMSVAASALASPIVSGISELVKNWA